MKKSFMVVAALVAAIALPSMASAETVIIKDHDHFRGARAEYRHNWHPYHHRDRVVIVKRNHHWD